MTSALEARTSDDERRRPIARPPMAEPRRNDADTLASEILEKLTYAIGKDPTARAPPRLAGATTLAVRDRIIDRWMDSTQRDLRDGAQARLLPLAWSS